MSKTGCCDDAILKIAVRHADFWPRRRNPYPRPTQPTTTFCWQSANSIVEINMLTKRKGKTSKKEEKTVEALDTFTTSRWLQKNAASIDRSEHHPPFGNAKGLQSPKKTMNFGEERTRQFAPSPFPEPTETFFLVIIFTNTPPRRGKDGESNRKGIHAQIGTPAALEAQLFLCTHHGKRYV